MDVRSLAAVEAIARLRTFTAAAQELHVAQPAVSSQVAGLERELGTRLFVRSARGATPTPAGLRVAARARRVQDELRGVLDDVAETRVVLSGPLRVGITPLLGRVDIAAQARQFLLEHPQVHLQVRTDLAGPVVELLEQGQLDVAIAPLDRVVGDRLEAQVLHAETLVLLTPAHWGGSIDLADLRDASFICLPEGTGLRRLLSAACARHGYVPRVDIEVTDSRDLARFVGAGLGAAVVAGSMAENSDEALHLSPLGPEDRHPPLGVVTRRRPPRAAAAFRASLLRARL